MNEDFADISLGQTPGGRGAAMDSRILALKIALRNDKLRG